ncbi:hypothetical protein D1872_258050 [compost metagenome]
MLVGKIKAIGFALPELWPEINGFAVHKTANKHEFVVLHNLVRGIQLIYGPFHGCFAVFLPQTKHDRDIHLKHFVDMGSGCAHQQIGHPRRQPDAEHRGRFAFLQSLVQRLHQSQKISFCRYVHIIRPGLRAGFHESCIHLVDAHDHQLDVF